MKMAYLEPVVQQRVKAQQPLICIEAKHSQLRPLTIYQLQNSGRLRKQSQRLCSVLQRSSLGRCFHAFSEFGLCIRKPVVLVCNLQIVVLVCYLQIVVLVCNLQIVSAWPTSFNNGLVTAWPCLGGIGGRGVSSVHRRRCRCVCVCVCVCVCGVFHMFKAQFETE
jgi:hypothetical protein